jgi:S-adenosylmethionine:tRNA ribosyltransferase-isomerase
VKTSDFYYHLPKIFIAQHPLERRDSSRLLVYDRQTGQIEHLHFYDLPQKLQPGDLLVINQTRVIRARIYGKKIPTGGKAELLLLRENEAGMWEALVGGKGIIPGVEIQLNNGPALSIVKDLGGPLRLIHFKEPVEKYLNELGEMPLPPYIHEKLDDPDRYQTVFAREKGSAAAPTAGLHFTPGLLKRIQESGIGVAEVTLHIGLDTFAPVQEEDPQDHKIHTEWCQLPPATAAAINQTRRKGGRVIAVGTTSVRTLETAARNSGVPDEIIPFKGETDLFILPGYRFRVVDSLLTNFHLPESTLLMLVSAFAGREKILELYQLAMDHNYRFYSFGDAMLFL